MGEQPVGNTLKMYRSMILSKGLQEKAHRKKAHRKKINMVINAHSQGNSTWKMATREKSPHRKMPF